MPKPEGNKEGIIPREYYIAMWEIYRERADKEIEWKRKEERKKRIATL